MSPKRNSISLETKYKIIKDVEKKIPYEIIKERYELKSLSNISRILQSKDKIIKSYENGSFNSKSKKLRPSKFPEIDNALVNFVTNCNSANVNISKNSIIDASKNFAEKLGISNFKGSNGHFEKFSKRNNIALYKIHGESGQVSSDTVDNYKSKLPDLIKAYHPKDIFNADELGLFFRQIPAKTYTIKGTACSAQKTSKVRVTVFVGANMDGSEKLKLLVIGKSKKPRCFKNIKNLPVLYESNEKSWMTANIFRNTLTELNQRMIKENRNILLFIDNCSAHPKLSFTNIKLLFFPPNTTSVLQPMDQGVIRSFKSFYRRGVSKRLISHLENGNSAKLSELTLLDAIYIANKAWNNVTQQTIKNCFAKCGFQCEISAEITTDQEIVEIESNEDNNFWEVLSDSIGIEGITFEDYVNSDNDVITCEEYSEQEILEYNFNSIQNDNNEDDINDNESNDSDETLPLEKPTFLSAIDSLNNLRNYLLFRDKNESSLNLLDKVEDDLVNYQISHLKQSKITSFLISK